MKILVAPDSYKGCLHAYEVAEYMEQGILEAFPQAEVYKMAVADGGEGTVKAIIGAVQGRLHEVAPALIRHAAASVIRILMISMRPES